MVGHAQVLIRFVFSEPPFMVPLPFIHAGYKEEVKLTERATKPTHTGDHGAAMIRK